MHSYNLLKIAKEISNGLVFEVCILRNLANERANLAYTTGIPSYAVSRGLCRVLPIGHTTKINFAERHKPGLQHIENSRHNAFSPWAKSLAHGKEDEFAVSRSKALGKKEHDISVLCRELHVRARQRADTVDGHRPLSNICRAPQWAHDKPLCLCRVQVLIARQRGPMSCAFF